MTDRNSLSPRSLLAQAMHYLDDKTGAVVPPIHTSTTYARNADYELTGGYKYTREKNPTDAPAERLIARLEGGADAKLFASGLSAATAVFETLSTGDHVVAPQVMYHGLQDWLRRISEKRAIGVDFVDPRDLNAVAGAIRPGETKIVWVEPTANPTWDVIDVAACAKIAHAAGAVLGVDSTVSPPVTTRALDLGADIVFHSTTKYLNGHSDVLGGVLITKTDDDFWVDIKEVRSRLGGVMGPFETWLLLRGMRTLAIRYERQSENALRIATHFDGHPKIERVLYPGLPSHTGYDIAKRQMTCGFGGMMSICISGGATEARKLATSCELFVPATSLGGVESLIEHRATIEGRHSLVPQNLLRLSVGIEDVQDLIADLEQALDKI